MENFESEISEQTAVTDMRNDVASEKQLHIADLNIIISLLQLVEHKAPLDEILHRVLVLIISAPRFLPASKASIHLVVNEGSPMRLAAQHGFEGIAPASCGMQPVERCECDRIKDKENIIFIGQSKGKLRECCQHVQGHYCVPLKRSGVFLGVLNFYVENERARNECDERFLVALSETLSAIVVRRSTEEELLLEHIQLRQKIKQHTRNLQQELTVRKRTEAELRKSYESLSKAGAEEHALAQLISLSLKQLSIAAYLEQAIQLLRTSVTWIGRLPKCGIFLSDDTQESLRLVATFGFSNEVKNSCSEVVFGQCLCGQAASNGQPQFTTVCCEPDKTLPVEVLMPGGHYSIPIMIGKNTLGVLVVYLPQGYDRNDSDERFLKCVADVLSMGITRRRFEKEVEYLKCHDSLTGLTNRNQFLSDLEETLVNNEQSGRMGAVLFIGLANFKKINDSLGHLAGDRLLELIAERLKGVRRSDDTVARVGGDEFIVMLPTEGRDMITTTRHAQVIAKRLMHAIARTYEIDGDELNIEANIGIAVFPAMNISANEVMQQAATAMQRAKDDGCNITRFFHPGMQELVDRRFAIEQDLRSALVKQRLQLYFQPQIDALGNLVGAEALLRCPDANGDMIRMDHCIEVAESTGLILQIGEWVLCEACAMLEAWSKEGIASPIQHLCVNISPKQFYQQNFVSLVKSILSEYEINPGQLVFEITEGFLIDSKQEAIVIMQELKSIGIGFAIDDFGTGYSSLSYLAQLPLDILKIDRAFVTGVINDSKQAVIVETLVAMANQLGFETISEGVESKAELEFLLEKGCECFQGYYYSPPKPVDIFTNELRSQYQQGDRRGLLKAD